MKYRREIDGLRALAILPVILFHAGFRGFSGGFVGVDVFFVISGYLITKIILAELEQGNFSIVSFYERRARRILPALFLVMLVCIPCAWFWLLPSDMKDFSQSLVAVPVFASNILFWRESGYFDTAAEFKPLLHTWSLAVEEQFYVLFPLFLMLFWQLGKRYILITLGLVFVFSLAVAQWAAYAKPAAAFYLLPTRGWELLMGVFAAFYLSQANRKEFGKWISELGGWLGVALIFYAVFAYSKATPYPGFYAFVPVLGTVLIILFATQQTIVGKFVGNKAFVAIGLVSYSAYLWHQPLFAFARHVGVDEQNFLAFVYLSILCFTLSVISWKYVEQPFRDKRKFIRADIFRYTITGSLAFVLLGFFVHKLDGKVGRFAEDARYGLLLERLRANYGLSKECDRKVVDAESCRTSLQPEILLWGDSYAMHLAQGFLSSNPNVKLIQSTVSQCAPVFDLAPANAIYGAQNCIDDNNFVFELVRRYPSIKYVVLSSQSFHLGRGAVATRDGTKFYDDELVLEKLFQTLDKIEAAGLTPVVFSPPPASGNDIGLCLINDELRRRDKSKCDFQLSTSDQLQSSVKNGLRRISSKYKVIWLEDGTCSSGQCESSIDDIFLYRDAGHLSYEGSALLGKRMNFYGLVIESEAAKK